MNSKKERYVDRLIMNSYFSQPVERVNAIWNFERIDECSKEVAKLIVNRINEAPFLFEDANNMDRHAIMEYLTTKVKEIIQCALDDDLKGSEVVYRVCVEIIEHVAWCLEPENGMTFEEDEMEYSECDTDWGRYLDTHGFCKSNPITGNRPCDDGTLCDKCRSDVVTTDFKLWKMKIH